MNDLPEEDGSHGQEPCGGAGKHQYHRKTSTTAESGRNRMGSGGHESFRSSFIDLLQDRIARALGPVKPGNIGAGRQGNAEFADMRGILIILGYALANLGRGDSNDGICGGIVFGLSAEYLNSKPPLVYVVRFSGQRLLGYKAQEPREPLTVAKVRIRQEPFQLITDRALL